MDPFLFVALGAAIVMAAQRGGQNAGREVATRWRNGVQRTVGAAERRTGRPAGGATKAGAGLGLGLGGAAYWLAVGAVGFVTGAVRGAGEGWRRCYAWRAARAERRAAAAEPSAAEPSAAEPVSPAGEPAPVSPEPPAVPAGPEPVIRVRGSLAAVPDSRPSRVRGSLAAVPDPAPSPRTTDRKDTTMPATITTGEVHTMAQLIAELEAIASEALAELEDAQADANRATELAGHLEVAHASLTALDLDADTLAAVGALSDAVDARRAAAEARAAAAELAASQATDTAEGVRARHQLMAEAHAATPHAADKAFYAEV